MTRPVRVIKSTRQILGRLDARLMLDEIQGTQRKSNRPYDGVVRVTFILLAAVVVLGIVEEPG